MINPYWYQSTSGNDPDFASVVLLLHFDGTNGSTTITDNSNSAHTVTCVGNAQLTTTGQKFGTAALTLDGTGDRISIADSPDWDLSGGDYAIEFWVKFNTVSVNCSLVSQATGLGEWALFIESGVLYYQRTGGAQNISASWSRSTGVWYFVQVVRSGSTTSLAIDGSTVATSANNPAQDSTKPLLIGGRSEAGTHDANAIFDDFRITKGVARSILVPTSAFPDS